MATMRVLVLVLTMWITWFAIGNHVSAAPRRPSRPPPPPPPLQTIASFDLNNPTTYPTFITSVRNKLADTTLKCKIQKISKTLTQRYGYIELIVSPTKKITLAIDKSNLYVLGYSDVINNKERAFFFKDVTDAIARNFFPGATGDNYRKKLTFNGNYIDLEKQIKRETAPLGISNLEISIDNIYGKAKPDTKKQVKFFLLAIQMVCEASKFKHISNKIPQDKFKEVKVDNYITALENGWDTLSTAVYNSVASTTTATKCALAPGTSPLVLTPWSFKNVEAIQKVMALLT